MAGGRSETETALADLKEQLKAEDTAAIRQAIDRTAKVAQKIGKALCQQSQAEWPAGALSGGASGGPAEDEVVDAEIVDDDMREAG